MAAEGNLEGCDGLKDIPQAPGMREPQAPLGNGKAAMESRGREPVIRLPLGIEAKTPVLEGVEGIPEENHIKSEVVEE